VFQTGDNSIFAGGGGAQIGSILRYNRPIHLHPSSAAALFSPNKFLSLALAYLAEHSSINVQSTRNDNRVQKITYNVTNRVAGMGGGA